MRSIRHCTALLLTILAAAAPHAAAPAPQAVTAGSKTDGTAEFLVFAGGRQIGREQVTLGRTGTDRIITSTGRHAPPIGITINRFELRYTSDWQPVELTIDAAIGDRRLGLKTSFGLTTAINEISEGDRTNSKTDQVSARTIVLPNGFVAAYEALAARLTGSTQGTELPIYVVPQVEVRAQVTAVRDEQIQLPGRTLAAKTYDLTIQNPGGPIATAITVDERGRLVRVDIPAAGLSMVRSDVASVSARQQTARNATDVDVSIPANGFSLAATMTSPTQAAGRLRHPAIILVPGSGAMDRDETVFGIPIFKQLAAALAERGFLVVRYDKRGFGRSGGRIESATLEDFADDVLSVNRWLRKRKDVDKRRIALVGHSEGGVVSMIAAGREDDIASLVLMATPGTPGAELILEQQSHQLDVIKATEEEKAAKVDLQKRIQLAVMTGVGWEGLPDDLRRQADTPWFKSFLLFDPARAMKKVEQPILILQGALDTQVPPHHADKLAELARGRKKSPPVEVVHLPGVNHLLVRAESGEVSEYAGLKDKTIVPEIAEKIAAFLAK